MPNPEFHRHHDDAEAREMPLTDAAPKPAPIENKDPLKLSNVPSEYTLHPDDPEATVGFDEYKVAVLKDEERRWRATGEKDERPKDKVTELEEHAAVLARRIVVRLTGTHGKPSGERPVGKAPDALAAAIDDAFDDADEEELRRVVGELQRFSPRLAVQKTDDLIEHMIEQAGLDQLFDDAGATKHA